MGTSKRYAAYYDRQAAERNHTSRSTCPVPPPAFGPHPLEWAQGVKPSVWAWITWADGPATRVPAGAAGWNDRVVVVEWDDQVGGARNTVVWRNAVTKRETPPPPSRTDERGGSVR